MGSSLTIHATYGERYIQFDAPETFSELIKHLSGPNMTNIHEADFTGSYTITRDDKGFKRSQIFDESDYQQQLQSAGDKDLTLVVNPKPEPAPLKTPVERMTRAEQLNILRNPCGFLILSCQNTEYEEYGGPIKF